MEKKTTNRRDAVSGNRLTAKQEKFVQEMVKTGNGTQSAITAGYSPKTAGEMAYENMKKPHVASQLYKIKQTAAQEVGLTQQRVLEKLMYWADKSEDKMAAASLKAIEMQARHLGMFNDSLDVSVKSHEEALKELEDE